VKIKKTIICLTAFKHLSAGTLYCKDQLYDYDSPLKHSTIFENEKGEAFSSFYNIYTTRAYLNLVGIKTTGNIDIPEDFDKQPGVLVNNALVDSIYLNDPTGKKITTHFQFLEGKLKKKGRFQV
jgi:hypothetical protein